MLRRRKVYERQEFPEEDLEAEDEPQIGFCGTDAERETFKVTTLTVTEYSEEDMQDFYCPRCHRPILSADKSAIGFVMVECRKCKRWIGIRVTASRHSIGFVSR